MWLLPNVVQIQILLLLQPAIPLTRPCIWHRFHTGKKKKKRINWEGKLKLIHYCYCMTMCTTFSSSRITSFQETWPKLEKWFDGKQNILVRVDADVDEEELYRRVESVLQHVMIQTQEGQWF